MLNLVTTRDDAHGPSASLPTSDRARDFAALSLADLLEARDLFHRHLTQKRGVVATAVGYYFIRRGDSYPGEPRRKATGPKRLDTTEIRDYSWPCVLVLVERWIDDRKLPAGYHPTDVVPQAIYMPNGKIVPVCVLEAPPSGRPLASDYVPVFPKEYVGGGYPLLTEVQGETHRASVGCLVTDGHAVFALTNRHVAGHPGDVIESILGGVRQRVGRTADAHLGRTTFRQLYPWPGENVLVNLDVGLVDVSERRRWTPQVYGVGPLGPMLDLGPDDLTLRLVGLHVRAFGCGSGPMRGRILGLFYRYTSLAGTDYVADFLIGPRSDEPFQTHPGDSGTLWVYDPPPTRDEPHPLPRPLAVQWGGHLFADGNGRPKQSLALATNLSIACRELGVTLVADGAAPLPEYWGTVGHFTIANFACQVVGTAGSSLRKLMQANLVNVTLALPDITHDGTQGMTQKDFVPLADVPDLAWKTGAAVRGPFRNNPENPNHFADMDEAPPDGSPTLLARCVDPSQIDPTVWIEHVKKFPNGDPTHAGLLPFRVWQIFDEMVDFAKAGDAARFVCAAGVLAHYVGDATQPLHCSYLHHGDPEDTVTHTVHHEDGTTEQKTQPRAEAIHSEYEEEMFRHREPEMQDAVEKLLPKTKLPTTVPLPITSGRLAAQLVIELMRTSFQELGPRDLVDFYTRLLDQELKKSDRLDRLWDEYGDVTSRFIARGALALARLWEAAWALGKGDAKIGAAGEIAQDTLVDIYGDEGFLRSYWLTEIRGHLQGL